MSFKDFWNNTKGGFGILGVLGGDYLVALGINKYFENDHVLQDFAFLLIIEVCVVGLILLKKK